MRKLFSRSITKIVAILSLTSLVQAAQFHLPNMTPGFIGQTRAPFAGDNPRSYEKVTIPGTTCVLFFPIDGSKPRTNLAGRYSGARYNGPNNDAVTDWWVRVFGGSDAVNLSYLIPHVDIENDVFMGFNYLHGLNVNPIHIITLPVVDNPIGFKRAFWTSFRTIAEDPVGRVLLYRLLIEIRRLDNVGRNNCCGDGIYLEDEINNTRKRNLALEICHGDFSFVRSLRALKGKINFAPNIDIRLTVLKQLNRQLTTEEENAPIELDIALFHEMLHWFHFLRHTTRYLSNRLYATSFKYNTRCYYGDVCELCVWGDIREEEIATILGSPNHNQAAYVNLMPNGCFYQNDPGRGIAVNVRGNQVFIPRSDKFLNGDDLSENVYRISKTQTNPTHRYMRFGHSDQPIQAVTMNPIPNRFRLAHKVAQDCYQNIIGNLPLHWFLVKTQAIK